jgi:muconolactone delta-isomerase
VAKFLIIQKQKDVPVPPEIMKKVLPAQFVYFKQLKAQGKVEAVFGFATEKGGCAIINAESHADLQNIANGNPTWPFVTWETYPLVTIEETEKSVEDMLSRMP